MKRIRVSAPAEQDLDDIWNYVAKSAVSTDVADRLIDSITRMFSLFAQAPGAGTYREEIAPGIRAFPVANYIIYYTETERHVVIARVLHGMRDQKSAFTELPE